MRGDMSGRFEGTAVLQINGDAGGSEAVVADAAFQARRFRAALYDSERIYPGHALVGELTGAAASGTKQGSLGIIFQSGRFDVGVQVFLGLMVAGDLVKLPALLVEPQPSAFALRVVVLDEHADHGGYSGEAVEHRRDERAVSQADDGVCRDGVDELTRFLGREHRRFALFDDVLGATHGGRRVKIHNLPGHQPVEEHFDGGQVLLHGRVGEPDGEALDVGGNVDRPDVVQRQTALLAPVEESGNGAEVGLAGVLIPDLGGEEFKKALFGARTLGDDESRPGARLHVEHEGGVR